MDSATITFERSKTINTKRNDPTKIIALRNEKINGIIKKWRSPRKTKDTMLFNIIRNDDSLEKAEKKIVQCIN